MTRRTDAGRQLYLSDLFWYFVARWRSTIVCMAVFAVLMAVLSVLSTVRYNMKIDNKEYIDKETALDSLSGEERDKVLACANLNRQYLDALDKYHYGKVMQIDATNTAIARMVYYVECDSQHSVDIMEAFRICAVGQRVRDNISSDASIGYEDNDLAILLSSSYVGNTLVVELRAETLDKVLAMAEYVRKEISQRSAELDFAHTITEQETDSYYRGYDKVIADAQSWLNDRVTITKKTYTAARDRLSQAGMTALNAYISDTEQPQKLKVTVSKKYLVFGLAGGFVVAFIVSVFGYIYSPRLVGSSDAEQMWNIVPLSAYTDMASRRRNLAIDRWIRRKWFGAGDSMEYIVSGVLANCRYRNISKLGIASTVASDDGVQKLADEMAAALAKNGIQTVILGNVAESVDAINAVSEIPEVVIVEKAACSRYSAMDREINFLGRRNIVVQGMITVV